MQQVQRQQPADSAVTVHKRMDTFKIEYAGGDEKQLVGFVFVGKPFIQPDQLQNVLKTKPF